MGRVMDETMAPMMDAMLGNIGGVPSIALSGLTGLSPIELDELSDKNLEEALALFDPDSQERNAAINTAFLELITEVMIEVEPAYRAGLARAYATRFTQPELANISAFLETDIGSKFAGESYIIYTDPQVMSAMNEMTGERARLADLLGVTVEELEQAAPSGPEIEAQDGAIEDAYEEA